MEKEELFREFADASLAELEKMEKRRIQVSSPREMLKQLFNGLRDPQPVEEVSIPFQAPPTIPPEFPKLLVSYSTQEWTVVENFADWAPIHHWWVRPMKELAALKEEGFRERLKEDWQRRKQKGAAG